MLQGGVLSRGLQALGRKLWGSPEICFWVTWDILGRGTDTGVDLFGFILVEILLEGLYL